MSFKPKFNQLDKDSARILIAAVIVEEEGRDVPDPGKDLPFLSQIIKKRVEVMKLPVELTNTGLLAVNAFAKNPGQAVALLVDFLTKFEGQKLTAKRLCEVYPWGFYDEDSFTDYVDNYLKLRKVKWAEVY